MATGVAFHLSRIRGIQACATREQYRPRRTERCPPCLDIHVGLSRGRSHGCAGDTVRKTLPTMCSINLKKRRCLLFFASTQLCLGPHAMIHIVIRVPFQEPANQWVRFCCTIFLRTHLIPTPIQQVSLGLET